MPLGGYTTESSPIWTCVVFECVCCVLCVVYLISGSSAGGCSVHKTFCGVFAGGRGGFPTATERGGRKEEVNGVARRGEGMMRGGNPLSGGSLQTGPGPARIECQTVRRLSPTTYKASNSKPQKKGRAG